MTSGTSCKIPPAPAMPWTTKGYAKRKIKPEILRSLRRKTPPTGQVPALRCGKQASGRPAARPHQSRPSRFPGRAHRYAVRDRQRSASVRRRASPQNLPALSSSKMTRIGAVRILGKFLPKITAPPMAATAPMGSPGNLHHQQPRDHGDIADGIRKKAPAFSDLRHKNSGDCGTNNASAVEHG